MPLVNAAAIDRLIAAFDDRSHVDRLEVTPSDVAGSGGVERLQGVMSQTA